MILVSGAMASQILKTMSVLVVSQNVVFKTRSQFFLENIQLSLRKTLEGKEHETNTSI